MTRRDLDKLAELLPRLEGRLSNKASNNIIIYRGEMRAVAALIRERLEAGDGVPPEQKGDLV